MTTLSESIISDSNKLETFKKVVSSYNYKLIKEKINKYDLNLSNLVAIEEELCETKSSERSCQENYLIQGMNINNEFRMKIKNKTNYLIYRMYTSN